MSMWCLIQKLFKQTVMCSNVCYFLTFLPCKVGLMPGDKTVYGDFDLLNGIKYFHIGDEVR